MKLRVTLVMVRTWLSISGNITPRRKPADFPRGLVYVKRLARHPLEIPYPLPSMHSASHSCAPLPIAPRSFPFLLCLKSVSDVGLTTQSRSGVRVTDQHQQIRTAI